MSNKDGWWDRVLVGAEPWAIAKIHEEVAAGRAERDALRAENARLRKLLAQYEASVLG